MGRPAGSKNVRPSGTVKEKIAEVVQKPQKSFNVTYFVGSKMVTKYEYDEYNRTVLKR